MAIDHIGFNVSDFAASRRFYTAALAPLGITIASEGEDWAMAGDGNAPCFWFGARGEATNHIHIAFEADSRAAVCAFHAAALAAGGRDNGAPGIRAEYHPSYYAAFVLDPDGHNIEAVCQTAEPDDI